VALAVAGEVEIRDFSVVLFFLLVYKNIHSASSGSSFLMGQRVREVLLRLFFSYGSTGTGSASSALLFLWVNGYGKCFFGSSFLMGQRVREVISIHQFV